MCIRDSACGGAGEAVGELAVVGDEEQAFAHIVQAADRVEALAHLVKKLHDGGAAFGILDRGHKALGLVQHEVAQTLGALQQLAVHADVVAAGVSLGAERGDHFAVYLHAALLNHFFGFAAAGHSGLGQDLLQPLELRGRTRLPGRLRLVFFGIQIGKMCIRDRVRNPSEAGAD